MGEVVPLSGAMRTIPIDAKTKYVNVTAHETVRFEANTGGAFAVSLAGVLPQFDLTLLAPAGVLDHRVYRLCRARSIVPSLIHTAWAPGASEWQTDRAGRGEVSSPDDRL